MARGRDDRCESMCPIGTAQHTYRLSIKWMVADRDDCLTLVVSCQP